MNVKLVVYFLPMTIEDQFLQFCIGKNEGAVQRILADGAIEYFGRHGSDNQWVQIWRFSLYGGLRLTNDDVAGRITSGNFWVSVQPSRAGHSITA